MRVSLEVSVWVIGSMVSSDSAGPLGVKAVGV